MQKTYKILSLLLDYPDEALYDALKVMPKELAKEGLLDEEMQKEMTTFIDACSALSLPDWQMIYVGMFDCSKSINLYLFDHIYGDSKERGQAMVNLKEMYEKAGLKMVANELPDYLPLFLEYISLKGSRYEAVKLLNDIKPILEKLYKLLDEKKSFYREIIDVLLKLSAS